MNDRLLPVVVVHGVGSGENKDRAGFSTVLSRNVDEVSRPVTRGGPYEIIKKVNAVNDSKNAGGIYWQEALWESENNTAHPLYGVFTVDNPVVLEKKHEGEDGATLVFKTRNGKLNAAIEKGPGKQVFGFMNYGGPEKATVFGVYW